MNLDATPIRCISRLTGTFGGATELHVEQQPGTPSTTGVPLSRQPTIRTNRPEQGIVVTASIASGTGALGGTLTAMTNPGGLATFSNLRLTGNGPHTLAVDATGFVGCVSEPITLMAQLRARLWSF